MGFWTAARVKLETWWEQARCPHPQEERGFVVLMPYAVRFRCQRCGHEQWSSPRNRR